jgi:hypothetical protein
MDLSQATLEQLLARGERAVQSNSTRTIRASFKDTQSPYWALTLDDRVLLHERMRAAETAGAVRLEWSKLGGDERPLDGVVLVSLRHLAAHLGRPTVADRVDTAERVLAPWAASELPIPTLLATWRALRTVRGMGPDAAPDFADAARLVCHLRGQPAEDRVLRQVSVELFAHSKRIEALQRHVDVLTAEDVQAPARHAEEVFARIGLRKEPQPFLVSGHGKILLPGEACRIVRPYVGVSPSAVIGYAGAPAWILTIENLTTFHVAAMALGARTDGLILYTGGMPSPAWCRAYARIRAALPPRATAYHWGDIDEGGFRIALVIQQADPATAGLHPWLMDPIACGGRRVEVSPAACAAMSRNALRLGWNAVANGIRAAGTRAGCEQESIPVRLPGLGPAG